MENKVKKLITKLGLFLVLMSLRHYTLVNQTLFPLSSK